MSTVQSKSCSQEKASSLPELEPHCGSWVVTAPDGRVYELYDRVNARRALADGWKVETAAQYLGRLNQEARS